MDAATAAAVAVAAGATDVHRPGPLLRLARLTLALLALAAIGQQLVIHVRAAYSVPNFFSYFTNLSNLFAALVLLLGARGGGGRPAGDLVRYVSAVNMAVVGLVFAVLLRDVDLGTLLPWVNTVLHVVMPVAVVLDWLAFPPATRLPLKRALCVLVFPALYLAYTMVRGAITDWYPYPFLDPARIGGPGPVAAYALGIAATFLLVGWALRAAGPRPGAASAHRADA